MTRQLLGSAGRAVFALSSMQPDLELHTYQPRELWPDIQANFAPTCRSCKIYPSSSRIQFSYLFPLGRPQQTHYRDVAGDPPIVTGKHVLTFGCVEGDFAVRGDVVVADLQGSASRGLRVEGCQADRLGIVLNTPEAMNRTGMRTVTEAANKLLAIEDAEVVVVKDGPNGARLYSRSRPVEIIPAYSSRSLYKIGSGDIFTAVFAHNWMNGSTPEEAADLASRHTAAYVEAPSLPLRVNLPKQKARQPKKIDEVIVVAANNSVKDVWFLNILSEAIDRLASVHLCIVNKDEVKQQAEQALGRSAAVSILWITENNSELEAAILGSNISGADSIFYINELSTHTSMERVFADLSQAIYELFWEPL